MSVNFFTNKMELETQTNYHAIADDFLEKYVSAFSSDIRYLKKYYNKNSLITLRTRFNDEIHEIEGFNKFLTTLSSLKINRIYYHDLLASYQPINQNKINILVHGKANVNDVTYLVIISFILECHKNDIHVKNNIIEFISV